MRYSSSSRSMARSLGPEGRALADGCELGRLEVGVSEGGEGLPLLGEVGQGVDRVGEAAGQELHGVAHDHEGRRCRPTYWLVAPRWMMPWRRGRPSSNVCTWASRRGGAASPSRRPCRSRFCRHWLRAGRWPQGDAGDAQLALAAGQLDPQLAPKAELMLRREELSIAGLAFREARGDS